jgi:hypothetical protein
MNDELGIIGFRRRQRIERQGTGTARLGLDVRVWGGQLHFRATMLKSSPGFDLVPLC